MQEAPIIKPTGLKPLTSKPDEESDDSKSGKSSGFVFGANLADRVVSSSSNSCFQAPAKSTNEPDNDKLKATALKRKFDAITGEEDEQTVLQTSVKLFVWNTESSTWAEKGRGFMKLNDPKKESPSNKPADQVVDKEDKQADTRETDTKDTDTKETDAKETDAKETDAKETDAKETDTKETDTKETDTKETDTKETDTKETDTKETDTNETDTKETDTKETDNKETDNKEANSKKTNIKDTEDKEDEHADTSAASNSTNEFPRLIMRISGTGRLILNVAINPEYFKISVTKDKDEKSNVFRFSDSRDVYAVSGSAKDMAQLRRAVEWRLNKITLSKQKEESSNDSSESSENKETKRPELENVS